MFNYLSIAKRIKFLITLLCIFQMSTVWAISCSSGSCAIITEIEALHSKEIRGHYPKRIIFATEIARRILYKQEEIKERKEYKQEEIKEDIKERKEYKQEEIKERKEYKQEEIKERKEYKQDDIQARKEYIQEEIDEIKQEINRFINDNQQKIDDLKSLKKDNQQEIDDLKKDNQQEIDEEKQSIKSLKEEGIQEEIKDRKEYIQEQIQEEKKDRKEYKQEEIQEEKKDSKEYIQEQIQDSKEYIQERKEYKQDDIQEEIKERKEYKQDDIDEEKNDLENTSNISNPTLYAGSIDPSKHTKASTDINRSITLLYQQSKQISKQFQKISGSISKDKSAIINQIQANKINQAVHTMKKVLIDDQKHITQLSNKLINNLNQLRQLLSNNKNKTLIDDQSQKFIVLISANNQQSANYLQYIASQIEHIDSYAKLLGFKSLSDFQYVGADLRPLPYNKGWYSQFLGDFASGEFSSKPMSTESYTVFLQKQVTPKVAHNLEYTHSINRSNTTNNSVFMRSASNELVLSTVLNTNSTDNLNLSVSYSNNKNDNYENTAFIGSRDGFTVGGSATYTKNIQDIFNQLTISPYATLSYYYTNMNAFTADNKINVNDQSTQQMRLDLAMNLSKNYQLSKDWNIAPSLNLDYAYQSSHQGDLSYTYISSGEQQSSNGGQTGDNFLNSYLGINLIWKNKLITFLQVGIENDNEGYLKDLQTSIQYLF